jgi:chemotaxis protein CheC
MGVPSGTTTVLGPIERSALGEVGNLTGSFFLNALAERTQLASQPSPPAVILDMGGAVLDLPLALLAQSSEEALIIDTTFVDDTRSISALFLVMPDLASLQAILEAVEKHWPSR